MTEDDLTEDLTGTMLAGRFALQSILGSGGVGDVYLAEHKVLGIQYAVKVLHEEMVEDQRMVERFKREAYAVSRLDHPNIVGVIDFGSTPDGLIYLVMEYVEGESLAVIEETASPDPVPLVRGLRILSQVAAAVQAAHDCKIIHRDLKPDNIVVMKHRDEDLVKILDFGLAKIQMEEGETPLTQVGEVFGTPTYMSPEQASGQEVDHRTDVYSLGVLAYEIAAGRPPFLYDHIPQVLLAHMEEIPEPPSKHRPAQAGEIPEAIEQIILQCLEKDRDKRPDKVTMLADVIQDHLVEAEELMQAARRAVPDDMEAVIRDTAKGSGWMASSPIWSPGEQSPTLRLGSSTLPEAPSDHPDDPAYRAWYWGQAIKLAISIAQRLLADGHGTAELPDRLQAVLDAEEAVIAAEADVAVAESALSDLETERRAREAEVRHTIVDVNMTLSDEYEKEEPAASSIVDLERQIYAKEGELAELLQHYIERQSECENALEASHDRLDIQHKSRVQLEINLLGELNNSRPYPCPAEYKKEYQSIAHMLQTLKSG